MGSEIVRSMEITLYSILMCYILNVWYVDDDDEF
jgi:hypothetical protein